MTIHLILSVIILLLNSAAYGINLNGTYVDLTLTSSVVYYVVGTVTINGSFIVPNDVEIVFNAPADGWYDIIVHGNIDFGCNDGASHSQSIYVHGGNNTRSGHGGIKIEETASASFCNTKFEKLGYGMYPLGSYTNKLYVNNCEFYDNYFGIDCRNCEDPSNDLHEITNTEFTYNRYAIYEAQFLNIANNIFVHNDSFETHTRAIMPSRTTNNIFNNTFNHYGNDSDPDRRYPAITLWSSNPLDGITNVTFNSFNGWPEAIIHDMRYGSSIIMYNQFIDNYHAAITIADKEATTITYNNFIDNTINIELLYNLDQPNCNLNWNGNVADITNPSLIAAKIDDFCDSNGYTGIVTFWPYFGAALDFTDIDNLPSLYTFDFTDCDTLNANGITSYNWSSSSPTTNPTTYPTADPTTDPTTEPTIDPTTDPTADPTTEPTIYPTTDPTTDPTIDPTTDPTIYPTSNPTTDPTKDPTTDPTTDPTVDPTTDPTMNPTLNPTIDPTNEPTLPTTYPTNQPTMYMTTTLVTSVDLVTEISTTEAAFDIANKHSFISAIMYITFFYFVAITLF